MTGRHQGGAGRGVVHRALEPPEDRDQSDGDYPDDDEPDWTGPPPRCGERLDPETETAAQERQPDDDDHGGQVPRR